MSVPRRGRCWRRRNISRQNSPGTRTSTGKPSLRNIAKTLSAKAHHFLEKYYLNLAERQSASGQEAGSYHAFALIYDDDFIRNAYSLFDQAEKAAEKPAEKRRIQFARIPVEMLKLYLSFHRFYCSFDFAEAQRKFEFMKSELQRYEKINPNLVCRYATRYLNRFYGKFVEETTKYSSGKYQIVYRVPDRLKTVFDINNCGKSLGFYRPEINDRDYVTTLTCMSTWDAQGLMGYRAGSVWYRVPFKLNTDLHGQPFGLLIGGADSVVRIWCNGEYAGTGQGFARPFLFDLTGLLKTGNNLLAIQVQRFGNSEIGTGGLIYPSFIFTGPRLKERAPRLDNTERILPGGAVEKIKSSNKPGKKKQLTLNQQTGLSCNREFILGMYFAAASRKEFYEHWKDVTI